MVTENSILDFLRAYTNAIRGAKDPYADTHRGSEFETLGGFTAILWAQQSQRNTDLFNSTRFNDANGQELSDLILGRYEIERIADDFGTGTATLVRPSAGLGAGTIWEGTRIIVATSNTESKYYRVSNDTTVSAAQLVVQNVPIRAEEIGPGSKIVATSVESKIADPLWDNTWEVQYLNCDDGTRFELSEEYRSRTLKDLQDNRVGYPTRIIEVCKEQGAQKVYLFRSDYAGDSEDRGLNVCYVGSEGFATDPVLIKKCKVALEAIRVCGDNLQILPLQNASTDVVANIYLKDSPSNYDTERLYQISRDAILQAIGTGLNFTRSNIGASIYRAIPEVQEVDVINPASDVSIMSIVGGLLNFPEALTRYSTNDIKLYFFEPR